MGGLSLLQAGNLRHADQHLRAGSGVLATSQANFTVPIPRNLLDGYGQRGTSDFEMDSYAAFGEVNYAFTQRLTATLGLRYTYEDKKGAYATQVFGGADLTGLPAATATELNRAKLSIFRPQNYTATDDGGSVSGRANLAYQFTDRMLGYVSYAHAACTSRAGSTCRVSAPRCTKPADAGDGGDRGREELDG